MSCLFPGSSAGSQSGQPAKLAGDVVTPNRRPKSCTRRLTIRVSSITMPPPLLDRRRFSRERRRAISTGLYCLISPPELSTAFTNSVSFFTRTRRTKDWPKLVVWGFQLPVDPSPNPAFNGIDNAYKVIGLIPLEYPRWLPIMQAHGHLSRLYRLMPPDS